MVHSIFCHYRYGIPAGSWLAMNVVGKKGLMEHGKILSVEPDGLVVHFGCELRRRELVPYGVAFGYTDWKIDEEDMQPGRAVEVLLRSGPGGPYTWYPGTLLSGLLAHKYGSFLFVEAHSGDISQRAVVESGQVRLPPSPGPQWRSLRSADFRTWTIRPLPAHVAELLPTSSPLWKAFCHKIAHRVRPVFVNDEELVLLARTGIYPGPQSKNQLDHLIRKAHQDIIERLSREKELPCYLPLKCAWAHDSAEFEEAGFTLHDVPHDILREAFTLLNTTEKSRCRRVCSVFNTLISQVLTGDIWINETPGCSHSYCDCSWDLEDYQFIAPILHCASTHTRTIILTNVIGPCTLSDILLFLKRCDKSGLCVLSRQVRVVAFRCDFGCAEGAFYLHGTHLAECMAGGCCSKLIVKECSLNDFPSKIRFSGSLPVDCVEDELYKMVERNLPVVDMQRAAQCLAQIVQLPPDERRGFEGMFYDFISYDPRVTNSYQDYDWTEDNIITVDVAKLCGIALYVLSVRCKI